MTWREGGGRGRRGLCSACDGFVDPSVLFRVWLTDPHLVLRTLNNTRRVGCVPIEHILRRVHRLPTTVWPQVIIDDELPGRAGGGRGSGGELICIVVVEGIV